MEQLKTEFRKNRFNYTQIKRENNVAIYQQENYGYEVGIIHQEPEKEMFGTLIPAHERWPGTGEWGTHAFTTRTLEKAYFYFEELLNKSKTILKKL